MLVVTSISLDPEQVQMVSVGPGELSVVVGSLIPFTEYSVVVVGATEGEGEGEESDPVTVTTLEAGELSMYSLHIHVLCVLESRRPDGVEVCN